MRDLTSWLTDPPADTGVNHFDGRRWTRHSYPEVARQVLATAAQLRRHGVAPGDRVALVLPTGPAFVRYFFATIAVGATPTPIAPSGYQGPVDYATFLDQRLATLRPRYVVSQDGTLDTLRQLPGWQGPDRPRLVDAAEPPPEDGDRSRAVLAKDDLALIQFTSGSSSAPRGVTLTNAAVLAQVELLADKYAITGRSRFASWLPVHHDMGLIGLFVTPVVLGCELWLMRPEHFVRRPLEWLRLFGEQGGTHAAVPNFALGRVLRRVRPDDLAGMDFSTWSALIVGSDRVSMPMLEQFHALLAPFGLPRSSLSPSYGMAEATLAVCGAGAGQEPKALLLHSTEFSPGTPVRIAGERTLPEAGRPAASDGPELHSVVSCGTELVGVDIVVTDEDGQALPDGHVGELLVRSPALSRGYFGDPPENERFTTGGYRTGDLGFRYRDEIYVLGRVGDSIKVHGRYVTAEDLELALSPVLGTPLDKLAVVLHSAGGEPVALVATQRRPATVDPARFADVLRSFGLSETRTVVLHVGALMVPRTTSGKPQRGRMWASFAAGELEGAVWHLGRDVPYRLHTDPDSGRARVVAHAAAGTADGTADGAAAEDRRELLGGKGHHLAVMADLGLPVPPFQVLTSREIAEGVPPERVAGALDRLAETARAGACGTPLGLAVRSSPPRSMPGMMDTLLGMGLTPDDVGPLAARLGDAGAAWELLLTQARQLCRHVGGADADRLAAVEAEADAEVDAQVDVEADAEAAGLARHEARYRRLCRLYTELTDRPYPRDAVAQVRVAAEAVRASWDAPRAREYRRVHDLPGTPGPAVVVQALVYGTAQGVSGSGVVFSHNPVNGDEGLFGEYLPGSTGEDLVAGVRTPRPVAALREQDAAVHEELARLVDRLHRELRAMVEVEFVVERGTLWLVQVRPAVAAPHVGNQVTLSMARQGLLDPAAALARLDVDALFTPPPAAVREPGEPPLAVGLPACAGVAHGPVVTSVEEVLRHPPGEVVLLRPRTEPADFAGIAQAAAVVTLEGGGTSHAAVVARELNVPTVVGARLADPELAAALRDGDGPAGGAPSIGEVTVCGTTGRVWRGHHPAAAPPAAEGADALLRACPPDATVCRAADAAPEGAAPVLLDEATGAPLAVRASGTGEGGDAASAAPRRARVCRTVADLPGDGATPLVATEDPAVAEEWVRRGGEVAFLHRTVDPDRPWRTTLPATPLAYVVVARDEQVAHARYTLAVAAARAADGA